MNINIFSIKYNNGGFTLVETVLYAGLIGMVLAGFVSLAWEIMVWQGRQNVMERVQGEAGQAIMAFGREIGQGDSVLAPSGGEASTTLIISRPGGALSTFRVSGGRLWLTKHRGAPLPITAADMDCGDLAFRNEAAAGAPASIAISGQCAHRLGDTGDSVYSVPLTAAFTLF